MVRKRLISVLVIRIHVCQWDLANRFWSHNSPNSGAIAGSAASGLRPRAQTPAKGPSCRRSVFAGALGAARGHTNILAREAVVTRRFMEFQKNRHGEETKVTSLEPRTQKREAYDHLQKYFLTMY